MLTKHIHFLHHQSFKFWFFIHGFLGEPWHSWIGSTEWPQPAATTLGRPAALAILTSIQRRKPPKNRWIVSEYRYLWRFCIEICPTFVSLELLLFLCILYAAYSSYDIFTTLVLFLVEIYIHLIYFQNGSGSNNVSSCHQGPRRPGTNHPPLKPSMKLQETSFSKHKLCNEKIWTSAGVTSKYSNLRAVNQQHISGVSRPWPTHQRVLAHKTSRTSRRKKRRNTMVSLLLVNMIMTPTTEMMMMIMIMTMDLPGIWPTCLAPINEAKW